MAEPKIFNNVVIGQFVLTGVPVKVYTNGKFLTITDVDDVEDPTMGFGMDTDGRMHQFLYSAVEFIQVQGNIVDIETYNKGMAALHGGGSSEDKKDSEEKEDTKEKDKEEDKEEDTPDAMGPAENIVKEDHYTFGTGDIINNKNPNCTHYGSKGIVIQIPQKGYVRYTVTNTGDTYKPGDILTKTADQLEKI